MLCLLWVKTLIVYSAAVTEVIFTSSCYIGPRYNSTRLYIKANYNTHSPLKVCWEVSKYWRLLHLEGKVFIITAHIVVMHMLAANVLFAKNVQNFCGWRKSIKQWNYPPPLQWLCCTAPGQMCMLLFHCSTKALYPLFRSTSWYLLRISSADSTS